jgi:integrase
VAECGPESNANAVFTVLVGSKESAMPRLTVKNPSYSRHKASGQAVVTLNGVDYYLGTHNSPASRAAYNRLIGEWIANDRRVPSAPTDDLLIVELCDQFWQHAQREYVGPDGEPSREADNFKTVLRELRLMYGSTRAIDFGPRSLKALMMHLAKAPALSDEGNKTNGRRCGWCRNLVNRQAARIKQVFKWAVSEELIPASRVNPDGSITAVYEALRTVSGLKRGKTEARESEPVGPVADAHVDAVLPLLTPQVKALVELQRLTGARAGELVAMKVNHLDRFKPVWILKPPAHKTAHHGHDRIIPIGPAGQQILTPFLSGRSDDAYLFSPREADEIHRERRHVQRVTPMSCGNTPGNGIGVRKQQRPKGEHYEVASYRRAVARACKRASIPVWHPHQLRHSAAGRLRSQFGIETVQAVLGHRTLRMSEHYSGINTEKAVAAMQQAG